MQTASVLRFLHAGDFRLGQVVTGTGSIPSVLKQSLLDAPWRSAEAVFDQAIAHGVDFVLLSGDIAPDGLEQGRVLGFLCDQFQKLRQHGVEVFWGVERTAQLEAWTACFDWPANVHICSRGSDSVSFTRAGTTLATIGGAAGTRRDLFSISLHGTTRGGQSADYTATHGAARSDSVQAGRTVHCPGPTQGLGFSESGPHGCSLVDLDHSGTVSIAFLETNTVRWETIHVAVPSRQDSLESVLQDQLAGSGRPTRLVNFMLDASETDTAFRLETLNLSTLRERLNANGCVGDNYWVCNIELGAGMSVVGEVAGEAACIRDFRQLVRRRGQRCTEALHAHREISSATPQTRLLSDVTRLGAELLS